MPPWPIAMPSSTAIVLNSRGIAPAARIASATTWPTSRRCTWPGTNSVKLLATATIGLPMSSPATPLARISARAPTMFLPWVTVRDRSGGMTCSPQGCEAFSVPAARSPGGAGGGTGVAGREAGGHRGLARRQRLVGGGVDALDLVAGQPLLAAGPGLGP